MLKIKLIDTKSGKPNRKKFLIRMLLKTFILFVIADIENVSMIMYAIILVIVPIKFKNANYTFYSLLGLGTNSTYVYSG